MPIYTCCGSRGANRPNPTTRMIALSDLLRVSLRQVIRQRTIGVVCSIALGITAFITLSVLGREIRYSIGQDMVLMGGVNMVHFYMDDTRHPGQPLREFYPDTITAIRNLPGIAVVSVNVRGEKSFQLRRGELTIDVGFLPVDGYYWDAFAAVPIAGRTFTEEEVRDRRRVCVLGREVARELFGNEEAAVGQLLFLDNDVFEVIGVVGGVMLGSNIRGGFLPYTTALDRAWGGTKADRLFVRAVAWEDVSRLKDMVPDIVKQYQNAPHLMVRTQEEQLARIQTTFVFVEALLWLGIVASLLLGGFGIWYGTFAAVRARTREVGLKKAMGGADADIMAQFLTEALCKSVAGGVLGIALGTFVVEIGSALLNCPVSYAQLLLSSIGSLVFSAFIGVAGGLYPAVQASRMDVVTALRFE